jgi:hypothetical protein
LYSYAPSGEVTVIVPVATAQVGWVRVAVGAEGGEGWALMVTEVGEEMHVLSAVLLALTLWEPGATPVKVTEAW